MILMNEDYYRQGSMLIGMLWGMISIPGLNDIKFITDVLRGKELSISNKNLFLATMYE